MALGHFWYDLKIRLSLHVRFQTPKRFKIYILEEFFIEKLGEQASQDDNALKILNLW